MSAASWRRLGLLRHAKSSWGDPALPDIERPLARRGEAAGALIGAWLAGSVGAPDLVLCSPARRARATWDLVAAAFASPPAMELRDALYPGDADALLDQVRGIGEDIRALWLIGHNPGFEDLAQRLAGAGAEPERQRMAAKYPTGAFAELIFRADTWADIGPGGGYLARFVRPRDLADD